MSVTKIVISCAAILFKITSASNAFESQCLALNDSADIKSFYYRRSCFVSDNGPATNYYDASCNHMAKRGFLAMLPGKTLMDKVWEQFIGHFEIWAAWIGLKRSGTDGAIYSKEHWYWRGPNGEQWQAPDHATEWHTGNPQHAGDACGYFYRSYPNVVKSYYCTATTISPLCQYRDYQLRFKKAFDGVRGSVNDTVAEFTVGHLLHCSTKCGETAICQSYSYSHSQGMCALHMLPAAELIKEEIGDGKIYDLY